MRVAMAAAAAFRNQDALTDLGEVVQHFARVGVVDNGAQGNGDIDVFAVFPVTIAALAMPAAIGAKYVIEAKFQQGVFVSIGNEVDIAAAASIAAARSAFGNEFFTTERNAAVPAISRTNCNFGLVDKHGDRQIGDGGGCPPMRLNRLDIDEAAGVALILELDDARNLRKQCVVFASSDVLTGFEFCSALTNEN